MARKPSKTALRAKADRLFSLKVRSRGYCQAQGFDGVECNGNLQTMHLVSRRYLSVRWDEDNAACGCQAHHKYLTEHPLAHDRFCRYLRGDLWEALKRRAEKAYGAPLYEDILERLRDEPMTDTLTTDVAYERLREHGPLSPSLFAHCLMAEFGCSEKRARDVAWHLIDHGRADPDADLRLVAR